jgi:hypothetical protein
MNEETNGLLEIYYCQKCRGANRIFIGKIHSSVCGVCKHKLINSYYDVLQLDQNATTDDVKRSYRKLAMKWHPDKNPKYQKETNDYFTRINEAYSVLSNPIKRTQYDDNLNLNYHNDYEEKAPHMNQDSASEIFMEEMVSLAMELAFKNLDWKSIAPELIARGCPEGIAQEVARTCVSYRKSQVRTLAWRSLRKAFLWFALGTIITLVTYFNGSGGTYLLAGGPILYGGYHMLHSLFFLLTGVVPNTPIKFKFNYKRWIKTVGISTITVVALLSLYQYITTSSPSTSVRKVAVTTDVPTTSATPGAVPNSPINSSTVDKLATNEPRNTETSKIVEIKDSNNPANSTTPNSSKVNTKNSLPGPTKSNLTNRKTPSPTPQETTTVSEQNASDVKSEKHITNFSIGSDAEDVKTVMGSPDGIQKLGYSTMWSFGFSMVNFDSQGKVIGWSDISHNLKVSIGEKMNDAPPFTLGSSTKDVVNTMGTPNSIQNIGTGQMWQYNYSIVNLDSKGNVIGWSNISKNLKMTIGNKKKDASPFAKGSSKNEVIDAMGTPDGIQSIGFGEMWTYDYSTVNFDQNKKVTGYSDISGNLNVK